MHKIILFIFGAMSLLLTTQNQAVAQEPVRLRPAIVVTAPIVTIGDFFEGAGIYAQTPLFQSPDYGTTGSVSALSVVENAKAAGFTVAQKNSLDWVSVTRKAKLIKRGEIEASITAELQNRAQQSNAILTATISSPLPTPLYTDWNETNPTTLQDLQTNAATNRFVATMGLMQNGEIKSFQVAGSFQALIAAISLKHTLKSGEIISKNNLVEIKIPYRQYRARQLMTQEQIVGMAVKHPLPAGKAITARDITQPTLVERGSAITLFYQIPGMRLTAQAKAMNAGGLQDIIEVMNLTTRKRLFATVTGQGQATVVTKTNQFAKLQKAQ
ncbi:flagellar basal body P-ring formation chaperone FlgA [Polycladidibacter stylochi]|uniref:flagellar basal body P-ring formation chaperone FlgA n=1 Tax=Polycladidibacter stylochi TaxID=1807766 RepID=UPI00082E3F8F|nr:flagellar basal body P-ring formation chaperone FlgA [Pseudovibrio stylochi]